MNMKRWVAAILTAVALVGTTIPAFAVSGGGTFKKYSFSDTSSNQDEEPAQDTNAYSLNISEENKSEFTLKAVKTSEKSNENDESSDSSFSFAMSSFVAMVLNLLLL